jgi:acyl-CoA reductase-like NAD-dependent aldehyde dehydrogenase
MFALNQGEICTCPSRLLVHEDIYEKFIARVIERTEAIKMGNHWFDNNDGSTNFISAARKK